MVTDSKGTTVVAHIIHGLLTSSHRYTTLRDATQLVLDSEHLGDENLANLASLLGSRHMELEVRNESEP